MSWNATDSRSTRPPVSLPALLAALAAVAAALPDSGVNTDFHIAPLVAVAVAAILGLTRLSTVGPLKAGTASMTAFAAALLCVIRSNEMLVPVERQVQYALVGAAAGASIFRGHRTLRSACAVLSLFVIVVSTTSSPTRFSPWIASTAVLLCVWWLIGDRQDASPGHVATITGLATGRRHPVVPALLIAAAIAIASVLFLAGGPATARAGRGWFASSGGLEDGADAASSGMGNGPDETSGSRQPNTVGFDASDLFVESDEASLYDAMLENYGKASRTERTPRMQGLRRNEIRVGSGSVEEDFRSGRRFEIVRAAPARSAKEKSSKSPASRPIAYFIGDGAPYLRLASLSVFDGATWYSDAATLPPGSIGKPTPDGWFTVPPRGGDTVLSEVKTGEIRVALSLSALPLTVHAEHFRMGRFSRPDLFTEWTDGRVSLAAREVPAGAVLQVKYRSVLSASTEASPVARRRSANQIDADPAIRALATEWSSGVTDTTAKAHTVIARLQSHCVYDPAATIDPTVDDPTLHFLTQLRRGPSYLFASAAAVLMREAGIDARLASGLRVERSRYDASANHTPILASDLHFWVEVRLQDDTWVEFEATPGLAPPYESPTVWQRLGGTALLAGRFILRHSFFAAALATILIGLLLTRSRWLPAFTAYAVVAVGPFLSRRQLILATINVLAFRAKLQGRPRPPGSPLGRWLRDELRDQPGVCTMLGELVAWAVYAPTETPCPSIDVLSICSSAMLRRRATRTELPLLNSASEVSC